MADRYLWDFLGDFIGGLNSDLPPISLDKKVASWIINGTVRGSYLNPRSAYNLQTFNFNGDTALQSAVENGKFQGAGFYRPDYGSPQIVAQISGRLFTFTDQGAAGWLVVEVTIPGDPNSTEPAQVWMNQAEKWLIITDGTAALPIFYDGTSCRRSDGPSVELGIVNAVDNASPSVGSVVEATLNAPWTHGFGQTVLFDGEFWTVANDPAPVPSYQAVLTNVGTGVGDPIPTGSAIQILSSNASTVISATYSAKYITPPRWNSITAVLSSLDGLSVGKHFQIYVSNILGGSNPYDCVVFSINTSTNTVVLDITGNYTFQNSSNFFVSIGSTLYAYPPYNPNVTVANTAADFTVPAVGSSVTVTLDSIYTGAQGQLVWIGTHAFTITSAPSPALSNTIYLISLTATTPIAGLPLPILTVPELPAGRMGAYVLGHQCMSLTDGISFIYGDTVGGPSGSSTYNYRDAVLKTTENTFLSGGGAFRIPNSGETISSMTSLAVLDAAYGQGPLQVGTPSTIFTCSVPTDRSTWVALTNPILTETLIGKGPLGQNSTLLVNSDTLFRSNDGLGSLIFGRREFTTWGNTPISTEVNRVVLYDDLSLLSYGSAVNFDNRVLMTCKPTNGNQGVYHQGAIVINLDPVSSLRGKAESVWEALWTGTNILQFVTANFSGTDRCFQFTVNFNNNKIQLVELLRTTSSTYYDNGTTRIPIVIETPCIFHPDERDKGTPIVRLVNGKLHFANVAGNVHVKVMFRPDFNPCWTTWREFDLCVTVDSADANSKFGYFDPIGLGEPPSADCESGNNRPVRSARFFQLRIELTGQCTLMGGDFAAVPEPNIVFPPPICGDTPTCQSITCELPDDFAYNLDNIQPTDSGEVRFGNGNVYYQYCHNTDPVRVTFIGVFPPWITVNDSGQILVVPATFYGATQAEADATALTELTSWIEAQRQSDFDCVRL